MVSIRHAFALRWVLPIGQLLVCLVALWPVRHEITHQVKDSFRFSRITRTRRPTVGEVFAVVIPERVTPEEKFEANNFEKRKWIPSVLNLPVMMVQLPYAILNSSKDEWVPTGMDVITWRAISWPLFGLIFWWSAGRGIEALLAARRGRIRPKISRIEALFAGALIVFCVLTALTLSGNAHPERDPDFPTRFFLWSSGSWAALAGITVLTGVLQWRIAKHSRRAA